MSNPRRYKSRMKAAIHETAESLFLVGGLDDKEMRRCDALCLTKAGQATAELRRQRRAARPQHQKSKERAGRRKKRRNPHHGSTLDSFLMEEGLLAKRKKLARHSRVQK